MSEPAPSSTSSAPEDHPQPQSHHLHEDDHVAPVRALLDLYEKGNKANFSSHTIVEEEVRILRGFVRSKKNIFEQLSTQSQASGSSTHLKPSDGVKTFRKWERKVEEKKEEPAKPAATRAQGTHLRGKSLEKPFKEDHHLPAKEPAVEEKKASEQGSEAPAPVTSKVPEEAAAVDESSKPAEGEEEEAPASTGLEVRVEGELKFKQGDDLQSETSSDLDLPWRVKNVEESQKPRFAVPATEDTPATVGAKPSEFDQAFEKMKQINLTLENLEVTRLQRRLTKVLSTDNSQQKLQALIMDALEREEDEERPVLKVIRAIEAHELSDDSAHLDISFQVGDLFGVIQELDGYKVRTLDGMIGIVPKEKFEDAPKESLAMFTGSLPSPTVAESLSFDEKSWAHLVGEGVVSTVSKDERSRQEAIYEFQSSEEAFCSDLESVIMHFVDPLREHVVGTILTEDDFSILFGNLKEIFGFSQSFLARLKKDREEQGDIIKNIGTTLDEEILLFRVYAPFCANLKRSIAFLNSKKEDQAFLVHFEACQKNFNRNLNLESFLLKPMQRVTKLPLLVKGIMKYTTEDHEDFEILREVISKTDEVAWFVNSECGKVDERMRLDKLQEQLSRDLASDLGPSFLKSSNRILLREGNLQRNSPDVKLRGFLFNDLVLFAKEDKNRFKLYSKPLLLWLSEVQDAEVAGEKKGSIKRVSKAITMRTSSNSGKNSPVLTATDSDVDVNKNFVLNDQGAGIMYDIKAPSQRDKMLWLEDIGIAIKKLRHDIVIFMRLLELKDPKSDLLDPSQCLTYNGAYFLGSAEGIYSSKTTSPSALSKLGSFKKRIHQLQIVEQINKFVTLEGKSGSVRVYPLSALEDPNAPAQKLEESSGSVLFKVGQLGSEIILACFSTKLMFFKYQEGSEEQPFVKYFDVAAPNLFCRSLDFIGGELYVSFGGKFYTVDVPQQKLQEVLLSESALSFGMSEPTAVKVLDMGLESGELLLCYSDAGLWTKGSTRLIMNWSSTAKSFARSGNFLFVFTTNYVEIWDWCNCKLVQAIRAPNIRPLNSFNSSLDPNFDLVESCLVTVTYLFQPFPHLCKLEVIS